LPLLSDTPMPCRNTASHSHNKATVKFSSVGCSVRFRASEKRKMRRSVGDDGGFIKIAGGEREREREREREDEGEAAIHSLLFSQ
ncbi:MAG: hypothetical protein VXV85_08010, partial [Candidatus Thermoplasmatota archaeon]|nr:hypothetical protein [Candidatus Thermoplasmatota archaeon]